ncbi:MAG: Wzz/FepE/Etk N-terminal domain-containing protein [Parvibaculales bacterium]
MTRQFAENDEIDLLELIGVLWQGKWVIIACIMLSAMLGAASLYSSQWRYISVIPIKKHEIPPIGRNAFGDFRTYFEDRQIFVSWLQQNPMAKLTWEDMTSIETIDNIDFAKPEGDRLIILTSDRKKMGGNGKNLNLDFAIVINGRDRDRLTALIDYARFCEQYLSRFYADMTRRELNMLKNRFSSLTNGAGDIISTDTMLSMVLPRENFLHMKELGRPVLQISQPLQPELVSPRPALTMALALMLGGMIGGVISLMRHYLKPRS